MRRAPWFAASFATSIVNRASSRPIFDVIPAADELIFSHEWCFFNDFVRLHQTRRSPRLTPAKSRYTIKPSDVENGPNVRLYASATTFVPVS